MEGASESSFRQCILRPLVRVPFVFLPSLACKYFVKDESEPARELDPCDMLGSWIPALRPTVFVFQV